MWKLRSFMIEWKNDDFWNLSGMGRHQQRDTCCVQCASVSSICPHIRCLEIEKGSNLRVGKIDSRANSLFLPFWDASWGTFWVPFLKKVSIDKVSIPLTNISPVKCGNISLPLSGLHINLYTMIMGQNAPPSTLKGLSEVEAAFLCYLNSLSWSLSLQGCFLF